MLTQQSILFAPLSVLVQIAHSVAAPKAFAVPV